MRMIFVPQFPSKMRYQEWWYYTLPIEFKKHGFEVLSLGEKYLKSVGHIHNQNREMFSPINLAIEFETVQIQEYMNLELREDDILFLADISFPGIFTNVLFHKKCSKMYAFCHATSLNKFDYFEKVRPQKYPIEKHTAEMFNKVFVGSVYHAHKLTGWHTKTTYLPFPPLTPSPIIEKRYNIMSASRPTPQKVDLEIETEVVRRFGQINRPISETWDEYFDNLAMSKILLITAHEDTFGYQIVDAVINGCIPLARRDLAYTELLPDEYLYSDVNELFIKINKILNGDGMPVPELKCKEQMINFYKNICDEMKGK
jgi:hypothetical protein